MPATAQSAGVKAYRPSQEFLDVFWTLSEGNDEQRNSCASRLGNMIASLKEEDEKRQVLNYCRERLIRGLSSGRKFARVGFSVALTRLLRQFSDIEASDILETIRDKLKIVKHEKKSKAEVGGIYLGRAFAYSALIQSGVVKQMKNEALVSVVDELTNLAEKKSYLKPVCSKTMEDLLQQVSVDSFGEHIWPKLREVMKQGWDSCTLDRLSLLITCRDKFPDVVNKKFIKKHWGFPLLGEENDEKLIKVILDTTMQNKEVVVMKLLPLMIKDRDVTSVWKGLGDKLMEILPEKKADVMVQRHQLGLQLAAQLIAFTQNSEQLLDLVLSPSLARKVFHNIMSKNDPVATQANLLFGQFRTKVEENKTDIKTILQNLWKLDSEEVPSGKVDITGSVNFNTLVDMLSKEDGDEYANNLIDMVKGKDKWEVLSSKPSKKTRQIDAALRQLQHLACSQKFSSLELQKSTLSLFLRLAFFKVEKKNKTLTHCESTTNFEEDSSSRKLCETFFFKSLDQLSTLSRAQQSKSTHTEEYRDLLFHLGQYFQSLVKAENIKPLKQWPDEFVEEWDKLFGFVTKIKQKSKKSIEARDTAFLLLSLFLGFHMVTDFKATVDLLQEVYVCYEKATTNKPKTKKSKKSEAESESEEPAWVEVVTEVLLSVLSLQSHLGRVIATMVFRSLGEHITPQAIQLITEVLIPKAESKDDVLVEAEDNEDMDEDDDDENILLDDDVPDEESEDSSEEGDQENGDNDEEMEAEDDDDDDEEEEEEEDEDGEQIDSQFREKVKEALGPAAEPDDDDKDDDEESLPDLSDSEMFKLDDMLAEVFRQRKKAGSGKKAREEKKREMTNFRARVLDLVEVLVKGERCGDFVLDLMKPLLLLILKLKQSDQQALSVRSSSLFHQLKSKIKTMKDEVHRADELVSFFQELVELAKSVSDVGDLQEVSLACHIVMALSRSHKDEEAASKCLDVLKEALSHETGKKNSKLNSVFFTSLIEMEPFWYQDLAKGLIDSLLDTETKMHGKMISCAVLSSLAKKKDNLKPDEMKSVKAWMKDVGAAVTQLITALEKDNIKVMLTKDIFTLALALAARTDVFDKPLFGQEVKQHLTEIRPKLNTDLRRLANKLIASIERSQSEGGKKDKKKKRKSNESQKDDVEMPPKKKQK